MLEYWFIYALLTCLSVWLVGFINKVIVEKKYNQGLSMTIFYFIQVLIYTIAFIYVWNYTISWIILFFWFLWGILDYFYLKTRFISLQWISSSLFFINSRLFSSIALLLLWVIIFWDNISLNEYIWFFIWFIVFWLLFEKEKVKNLDYKKWLIFLWIWIILLVVVHFGIKYVTTILDNLFLLFLSYSITALFISVFSNKKSLNFNDKNLPNIIFLNIFHAIFFASYVYFLFNTYDLANLWIAYKIQSYSIFIPIILSIIFFKEKITYKNLIAFVLIIISLWFFI